MRSCVVVIPLGFTGQQQFLEKSLSMRSTKPLIDRRADCCACSTRVGLGGVLRSVHRQSCIFTSRRLADRVSFSAKITTISKQKHFFRSEKIFSGGEKIFSGGEKFFFPRREFQLSRREIVPSMVSCENLLVHDAQNSPKTDTRATRVTVYET